MIDPDVFIDSVPSVIAGLGITISLVAISYVSAFILSMPFLAMRLSSIKILQNIAICYSFFFRGTPLLVQLFLLYYGIPQFECIKNSIIWDGFLSEPLGCAIAALTLNATAYMTESIYGGVQAIPKNSIDAAKSFGMSRYIMARDIIIPLAFRNSLGAFNNEWILLIKGSAVASTITIMELTSSVRTLISRTYSPFEFYGLACVCYVLLSFFSTRIFYVLERRFQKQISRNA